MQAWCEDWKRPSITLAMDSKKLCNQITENRTKQNREPFLSHSKKDQPLNQPFVIVELALINFSRWPGGHSIHCARYCGQRDYRQPLEGGEEVKALWTNSQSAQAHPGQYRAQARHPGKSRPLPGGLWQILERRDNAAPCCVVRSEDVVLF